MAIEEILDLFLIILSRSSVSQLHGQTSFRATDRALALREFLIPWRQTPQYNLRSHAHFHRMYESLMSFQSLLLSTFLVQPSMSHVKSPGISRDSQAVICRRTTRRIEWPVRILLIFPGRLPNDSFAYPTVILSVCVHRTFGGIQISYRGVQLSAVNHEQFLCMWPSQGTMAYTLSKRLTTSSC